MSNGNQIPTSPETVTLLALSLEVHVALNEAEPAAVAAHVPLPVVPVALAQGPPAESSSNHASDNYY